MTVLAIHIVLYRFQTFSFQLRFLASDKLTQKLILLVLLALKGQMVLSAFKGYIVLLALKGQIVFLALKRYIVPLALKGQIAHCLAYGMGCR